MPRTVIAEDVDLEKLQPMQDHLLIKVLRRDQTVGGIHLPKNQATAARVGKVLGRGPAIPNTYNGKDFPIKVEPGEYVIFMDYAGEKVRVVWQDYRLIREHGLWAKVEISPSDDLTNFESIEPWAERVVLERRDETKTKSGLLYLANSNLQIAWNIATVKWAGFGVWHQPTGRLLPCETKPGDRVLFRRYSGEDIRVRGKEYRITQEVDVIAILEGEGDAERLKPLRNKVVIEREAADAKTKAGLIIPDTAKVKHARGVVTAASGLLQEDGELHPPPYAEGDRVLFRETPGMDVKHNGKEYVIVSYEHVLAIIE